MFRGKLKACGGKSGNGLQRRWGRYQGSFGKKSAAVRDKHPRMLLHQVNRAQCTPFQLMPPVPFYVAANHFLILHSLSSLIYTCVGLCVCLKLLSDNLLFT